MCGLPRTQQHNDKESLSFASGGEALDRLSYAKR